MANDSDRLTSGSGGNTGGTGGAGHSGPGSGAGVGAAGSGGEAVKAAQAEQGQGGGASQDVQGPGSDDLAHADLAVREAVEGGSNAAGIGEHSGKLSSEGTGPAGAGLGPSAGDIGGMGGARATPPNHDNRPPGGVSPLSNSSSDD